MPCSDGINWESEAHKLTKNRLDYVTNLLCGLCKAMEDNKVMNLQSPELREWYEKHKWEDIRRGTS